MARSICDERSVAGSVPVGWHQRFVGVPFLDGGRDFRGCDCWGLVRLVYAEVLNIKLPSYGDIAASDLINVARNIGGGYDLEPWVPAKTPKSFDVVVMRFYGSKVVGHVGVLVDGKHLIHTERSMDSVMIPTSHWTVNHRIHCFRRHKSYT
jgi:cell wall-associated NlpC family hydrolase